MIKLPEEVKKAWENKEKAVVFTTVDADGTPNSIYATCTAMNGEDEIVIADNYFSKTKENIRNGSRASVLFITPEGKSYQVKGDIEYKTEGTDFDFMKSWNPKEHPGHGAVVLKTQEVYSGKNRLA